MLHRSKMNVYTARHIQMRQPGGSPVWIPRAGGSSLDVSVTSNGSAPSTPAKTLNLGDATGLEDVAEDAAETGGGGGAGAAAAAESLAAVASNDVTTRTLGMSVTEAERHVAMRMKELKLLSQGSSATSDTQQQDDANAAAAKADEVAAAARAAAEQEALEAAEDEALERAEAEEAAAAEAEAEAAKAKAKAKADIERLAEERARARAVAMMAESEASAAKAGADAEIAALKQQLADAAAATAAADAKAAKEHEARLANEAEAAREHEARTAAEALAQKEHEQAQKEHEQARREHAEAEIAHKEAAVAEAEALAMAFMSASGNLSADVASHLTPELNMAEVAKTKRAALKARKEQEEADAAAAAAEKSASVKSEAAKKRAEAKAKKEAKVAAAKKAADEEAAAAAAAAEAAAAKRADKAAADAAAAEAAAAAAAAQAAKEAAAEQALADAEAAAQAAEAAAMRAKEQQQANAAAEGARAALFAEAKKKLDASESAEAAEAAASKDDLLSRTKKLVEASNRSRGIKTEADGVALASLIAPEADGAAPGGTSTSASTVVGISIMGPHALYTALDDYNPHEGPNADENPDDELAFLRDDIVNVYGDMDDDGFYTASHTLGETKGREGVVPSTYFQLYATKKVIALQGYNPAEEAEADPDDLSLVAGDILAVIKEDDGFYDAVHVSGAETGVRGYIPVTCVGDYDEGGGGGTFEGGDAAGAGDDGADLSSFADGAGGAGAGAGMAVGSLCVVLYDYDPQQQSPNEEDQDVELAITAGQVLRIAAEIDADGFYSATFTDGASEGKTGLVPSTFIEEFFVDAPTSPVPPGAAAGAVGAGIVLAAGSVVYQALYKYEPEVESPNEDENEDELGFDADDFLQVFGEVDPDGFYEARLLTGPKAGKQGFIPSNFVREASPEDQKYFQEQLAGADDV